MRLNRLLDGMLMQIGGQSWQQAKLQAQLFKAQKTGGANQSIGNSFTNTLSQMTLPVMPTPPIDTTDAAQMAQYNQQLLQYINRLNAQQALTAQRMQAQMVQLVQALQQSRNTGTTSVGNNTQYPAGSQLSQLSGVVSTQPDSLLLDPSKN